MQFSLTLQEMCSRELNDILLLEMKCSNASDSVRVSYPSYKT